MICRNHVDVSEGVQPCARCGNGFCTDCVVTIHGQPYCATCKTEKLLDVQSGTDRAQLALATIGRRFAAMWIDRMMFVIAGIALIMVGALFMKPGDDSPVFVTMIIAGFAVIFIGYMIYEGLISAAAARRSGKWL